ncbi:hypothetical protein KIW84_013862 [Lathyrus oleraceus]|uniref:Uncharacterized protein n=1 Tax=Pisum sativum TaxID=3888 RepID=A0A9D5GYD5_PEA|nr:hypothetical protein KIW84_013862 [Pisum sativum]
MKFQKYMRQVSNPRWPENTHAGNRTHVCQAQERMKRCVSLNAWKPTQHANAMQARSKKRRPMIQPGKRTVIGFVRYSSQTFQIFSSNRDLKLDARITSWKHLDPAQFEASINVFKPLFCSRSCSILQSNPAQNSTRRPFTDGGFNWGGKRCLQLEQDQTFTDDSTEELIFIKERIHDHKFTDDWEERIHDQTFTDDWEERIHDQTFTDDWEERIHDQTFTDDWAERIHDQTFTDDWEERIHDQTFTDDWEEKIHDQTFTDDWEEMIHDHTFTDDWAERIHDQTFTDDWEERIHDQTFTDDWEERIHDQTFTDDWEERIHDQTFTNDWEEMIHDQTFTDD